MTTRSAFPPLHPALPEPAPPRPGRGLLALVLSGLLVLTGTALAGRYFWADEGPRAAVLTPSLIPADFAPRVWIWSPDGNISPGFAEQGEAAPLTRLPAHAPLPRLTERYVASQPVLSVTALPAPQPAPRRAGRSGPAASVPAPVAAPDAEPPVVTAGLPPLVPPRRPGAPLAEPAALAEAGTADEPIAPQLGLGRSLLPRARPEAVAHLAGLAPAAPTAPAPPPPATIVPASLDVPAPARAAPGTCPATLARAIPRRASGAEGGQAAIARLAASGGAARDNAIAQAVIAGNIPDFLRQLVPVTFEGAGADGRRARITLCVMPDYLALGSNNDFVRVPLGLPAANLIAERFDMVLPTTRMVDAIHAQANLRLRPSPMTPGAEMVSTGYFLRHNATLETQRRSAGGALGALVSGHKKDLVLSNRLERNPGRVAIYGWHRADGQPIQPLSTVHGAGYADYSHGIRLVSRTAFVNGQPVDLRALLGDARYAGLISNEGPIASRLMLAALR